MSNSLRADTQATILCDLVEKKSIRGCSRSVKGKSKTHRRRTSKTTVMKLLVDGGDAAIDFNNAKLRNLPCKLVESDELFTIIGMTARTKKKQAEAARDALSEGRPIKQVRARSGHYGEAVVWVAIDPTTKLWISTHVGGETFRDARTHYTLLRDRLAGRVQLTTDSLKASIASVKKVFEDDIDYATVKKRDAKEEKERKKAREEGRRYIPINRGMKTPSPPEVRIGSPDLSLATTNHIEVFFTGLRRNLAHLARKSTCHAKTEIGLRRILALHQFYYNFVRGHESLNGITPAVRAGIEDTPWDFEDFIVFIEEHRKRRKDLTLAAKRQAKADALTAKRNERLFRLPGPGRSGKAAKNRAVFANYCVSNNTKDHKAKIHKIGCAHLRLGSDRAGSGKFGNKLFCETFEEAEKIAADLDVDEITTCRVCIGEYITRSSFGPR